VIIFKCFGSFKFHSLGLCKILPIAIEVGKPVEDIINYLVEGGSKLQNHVDHEVIPPRADPLVSMNKVLQNVPCMLSICVVGALFLQTCI
jgi:hypothetical protein